jgi:hypothetical protein
MLSRRVSQLIGRRLLSLVVGFVLTGFLAACTLTGCSTTRWVGIESGQYVVDFDSSKSSEVTLRAIQNMEVLRDEGVTVFTLANGSEIVTSFVPRDRANWPAGCPAMLGSTRMEVLDLAEDTLPIGSVALSNPILVRGCPPDPVHVVLREDGEIGGGGGACSWPRECIYFLPKRELPWQAIDSAATTDQDSPVTIDIIASANKEYDRIDAASFTVTNGPENGMVVNNLELTGTIKEDTGFNGSGSFIIRFAGLVTYTPNAGFHGTDAFTFRVCDMDGYCDTATVAVTVNAVGSS